MWQPGPAQTHLQPGQRFRFIPAKIGEYLLRPHRALRHTAVFCRWELPKGLILTSESILFCTKEKSRERPKQS
jgi:hypothetical protein